MINIVAGFVYKEQVWKVIFSVVEEIKKELIVYLFTCKISICLCTFYTLLYMYLRNLRGREVASASG